MCSLWGYFLETPTPLLGGPYSHILWFRWYSGWPPAPAFSGMLHPAFCWVRLPADRPPRWGPSRTTQLFACYALSPWESPSSSVPLPTPPQALEAEADPSAIRGRLKQHLLAPPLWGFSRESSTLCPFNSVQEHLSVSLEWFSQVPLHLPERLEEVSRILTTSFQFCFLLCISWKGVTNHGWQM